MKLLRFPGKEDAPACDCQDCYVQCLRDYTASSLRLLRATARSGKITRIRLALALRELRSWRRASKALEGDRA